MKKFSFFIDDYSSKIIFKPIRSKKQALKVLFFTIKLILLNNKPHKNSQVGKIVLVVSKMSRLFYFSKNKYFSISFPFNIIQTENSFQLSFKDQLIIDNKISTELTSLLEYDQLFDSNCGFEFIDILYDEAKVEPKVWPLFLHLLMSEDGYIRYDYDEKGANGLIHPLNHYDIFYSSNPTFKLGLNSKLTEDRLIDLLSIETNCHFIE